MLPRHENARTEDSRTGSLDENGFRWKHSNLVAVAIESLDVVPSCCWDAVTWVLEVYSRIAEALSRVWVLVPHFVLPRLAVCMPHCIAKLAIVVL